MTDRQVGKKCASERRLRERTIAIVTYRLKILATLGTAKFLADHGISSDVVNKAYEGGRTIVDMMKDGMVDLVLNTTEGAQAVEDSRSMRTVALYDKIPYYTTLAGSHAAALAMKAAREGELAVRSLQG